VALARESWPKGASNHQKVQYDKVQANVAADDGVFALPAAHPAAAPVK
jgi:hypothetical protein